MPNTISNLRNLETSYLSKHPGKLDATDAKKLYDAAKKTGNQEDVAAVREMFMRDGFADTKVRDSYLGKLGVDTRKTPPSLVAGKPIGNTTVVRTFGPPEGYHNKFQAIAAARTMGTDPLAIIKDASGHWHAAQTKEPLTGKPDLDNGFALQPVDKDAQKAALNDTSLSDDQRAVKLAVAALGVPADLINVSGNTGFKADKININPQTTSSANGRAHIHDDKCGCNLNGAKVELSLARLKSDPDFVAGTLFHEGQHKADDDVKWAPATTPNEADKTHKSSMSGASSLSHEGSAYARAFVATIDKNREVAYDQLLGFAANEESNMGNGVTMEKRHQPMFKGSKNLEQDRYRMSDQVRPKVMAELKAHYATLPKDKQDDFKLVVALVEKRFPDAKIWSEVFGKEPMPKVTGNEIPIGTKRAKQLDTGKYLPDE